MSFSGYYQLLCEHGHYFEMDAYKYELSGLVVCPICRHFVIWWNLVDTTNGKGCPVELEVLDREWKQTCPTCGHVGIIRHTRYRIPNVGHRTKAYTDLDSGHDGKREEDKSQDFELEHGDSSRLPGD